MTKRNVTKNPKRGKKPVPASGEFAAAETRAAQIHPASKVTRDDAIESLQNLREALPGAALAFVALGQSADQIDNVDALAKLAQFIDLVDAETLKVEADAHEGNANG